MVTAYALTDTSHDHSTALDAGDLSHVPLSVQRTLRGSSQARGQLSVALTNNWLTEMHVIYLETMPWLLQFYLHTLRIYSKSVPRGAWTCFLEHS
jgi:phosphatidylinositol glycan class T